MLFNTFTAYDKYSVLNREYLTHPIHMQLSQKQKTFSNIFLHFGHLDLILNILKKETNIRSWQMCFQKYGLPKRWLDKY